uniref:MYB family transcription factor n=1 Tax=Melilotus albus TaxID=47082 RepID=A0A896W457_MELAB|nr:MYB family transcription factor [Melilotus albus]
MSLFSKQEKGNDGDTNRLKKGPWSSDEDEKLRKIGLPRCGKSCRLRWLNHLHPNLKKGSITEEEEQKIIELHARIGPRWAKIAQELPGRSDNEIKNFWNIRKEKYLRKGLPLYDQMKKPHDGELNDNGESSVSNQELVDGVKFKRDIFSGNHPSISNELNGNNFEQLSNSYHVSIMQPLNVSNMLCNNVASTSISNNTSPSLTNRGETSFMTAATESDLSQFQGGNSKWSEIDQELSGRTNNEIKKRVRDGLSLYDQIINLDADEFNDNGESSLSKQEQVDVSQVDKSDLHGVKFQKDNFSRKYPTIPHEINGNNFKKLANSLHISTMQPSNVSNMQCNNVVSTSISNNTSTTLINGGGSSFMSEAMESNLPPKPKCLGFQSLESPKLVSNMLYNNVANTSISNHTSPTSINRAEIPFMTMAMESDLPPFPECLDFQSPKFINVSSMLYNNVANTSPIIDMDQTSFMCTTTESNLPPFPEFLDFQSLDSPMIQNDPLLPLQPPEEIPHESFEPDFPCNGGLLESMFFTTKISEDSDASHMHSNETRSADENGKKPISLEKDESNHEDLIDSMYGLGWLDDVSQ